MELLFQKKIRYMSFKMREFFDISDYGNISRNVENLVKILEEKRYHIMHLGLQSGKMLEK